MALQPGEIIDGKYRIVRMIGEGGMGAVYEGENTRIKRKVAIKVLHAGVAEKTDVVQRFEREAQAAGRIGSEHIVEVLDLGNLPSGERFMVMEYLDGEDVTTRIKSCKRIEPQDCVPILDQVLDGLAAAHDAGIIHRDLKPDNIYLLKTRGGRADFVKILDFGVSKFSALDNEMSMTRTGAVMGTPYYMSPEQAKGGKIDHRSDLYAIGVVLYQMVTGRVPFNAGSFNELLFKIALESPEPIEEIVPECPREFINIVNRAMAREADARYQSAAEFKAALDEWAAGAGKTEAMPAVPDMRASMPSVPEAQGPLAQSDPHHAQLGQSDPHAQSSPQMVPGTQMAVEQGQTQMASPDQLPGAGTGQQQQLSQSQAALAVTTNGKGRRGGLMVALLAVVVILLGGGAVGAYVLTTQREEGPTTAATSEPETTDEGSSEGEETTEEDEETTEEEPEDDPEEEPIDLDETADAEPTAEPTAEATSEPASTQETEPQPAPPPVSQPWPRPQPQPQPQPQPPPPPPPDPEPQPKPEPGRSIKTEL